MSLQGDKRRSILNVGVLFFVVFWMLFAGGCSDLHHHGVSGQKAGIEKASTDVVKVTSDHDSAPVVNLAFDPALVMGTLDNGFKYILLENSTPENRVSMHLDVLTGSMNETEEQRGIAHFLEHMVFNGSTHFKPGELVEYFQSIGMSFGGDANAHTSFFETVYDIFLPSGDKKSLEQGLVVLDDYARGALLLDSEVDKERGVVLSEKRDRDSVSYRTFQESLKFSLPGSRINNRLPIGLEKVIKKADSKLFRSYYNTWYRPENMVLIMVGDFNALEAEELLKKKFFSMKPRSDKKYIPEDLWEKHSGLKVFYHYEAEAGNTDVSINTITKKAFKTDTLTAFKERAVKSAAKMIFQNRLSKLVRKKSSPCTHAGIYSGDYLHNINFSAISADSDPDKWRDTLVLLENRLRQALEFGFTRQELKRVKADFLLKLDKSVKERTTRKSSKLARKIISQVNRKRVFQSPEQRRDILKPFILSLTVKDVNSAFEDIWAAEHRLVEVTGNALIDSDKDASRQVIRTLYNKSKMKKIARYQSGKNAVFPYLPEPLTMGTIKKVSKVKDLGISIIDMVGSDKNQVRLNLKKTEFKKGEFIFRVDFGKGRKAEPVSKPGLGLIAASVINESGLDSLDRDQLDAALAGRDVNIRFNTDQDGFSLSGRAGVDEAELVFQLVRSYFLDAGFRQEALLLAVERYKQMYQSLLRTQQGMMQLKGDSFLAGKDSRFGMPKFAMVEKIRLKDIESWIKPVFENADIEISVAGDFDSNSVIAAVQKYMGTLPESRGTIDEITRAEPYFPCGKTLELKVETKINKGIARLTFLTDDFWNIKQTRRLNILATVFSDRLRKRIRENLGAAYSPYAYNNPSKAYDGYGVFNAVVSLDPDKIESVVKEMEMIAFSLAENGVEQDELTLALEPVKTHIKDMKKTNEYWLNSVLSGCKKHSEKFEWARDIFNDYASISEDDISALAESYFKKSKKALIIIKPF
ncbi:MAG: insulinase family protein [Thermodesulfobacteriota bacterium]|nr:insulinase family protein [Thermodesulfobacteriota bacterium]